MTFGNYIFQDNTSQSRQNAINQIINTADKLEAGHLKAVETASQLRTAIGSLDFNEQDAWLKDELLQGLEKTINDNIQYGNLYYALDDLIATQGNIFSDPRVTGRLKAQQAYKAFLDYTNKRTDITEDKKEWIKYLNPYNYEDVTNDNGRIMEGKIWTLNKNIDKDFDFDKLLIDAIKLAAPDIQSRDFIVYTDVNGNPIDIKNNPSGVAGAYIQRSGSDKTTKLEKEDIEKAVNTLLETRPGAKTAVDTEREFAKWYYETYNDDKYGILVDGTNVYKNPKDFIYSKLNQGIEAATYLNKTTTLKDDILGATARLNGSGANLGENVDFNPGKLGTYGRTTPMEVQYDFDTNSKTRQDSYKTQIAQLGNKFGINTSFISDDSEIVSGINNMIEGIKTQAIANNENYDSDIEALNNLKDLYQTEINNRTALRTSSAMDLSERDKKKYDTYKDLLINWDNPNQNNEYIVKFSKIQNKIFELAEKTGGLDNNGNAILEIDKASNQNNIIEYIKGENIPLGDYGIKFDGKRFTIPNNIPAVMLVSKIVDECCFVGIPSANREVRQNYDAAALAYMNQNGISTTKLGLGYFKEIGDDINDASKFVAKQENKHVVAPDPVVYSLTTLPQIDYLTTESALGTDEQKKLSTATYAELNNTVAGSSFLNYEIYTHVNKKGKYADKIDNTYLRPLINQDDKITLRNVVTAAINDKSIIYNPAIDPIKGAGTLITIPAKYSQDGKNVVREAQEFFIPGLTASTDLYNWENHSHVIADNDMRFISIKPGQSKLSLPSGSFQNLGKQTFTSLGNVGTEFIPDYRINFNFQNRNYNISINDATDIHEMNSELYQLKQQIKAGLELNDNELDKLDQMLNKYAILINLNTGVPVSSIITYVKQDLGITK